MRETVCRPLPTRRASPHSKRNYWLISPKAGEEFGSLGDIIRRGPEFQAVVFNLDAYCTSNIEVTENMVLSNIDVSVRSIPVTKYPIPTTSAKESTVKEGGPVDRVQPVGTDDKVYRPVAPCLTGKDLRCI